MGIIYIIFSFSIDKKPVFEIMDGVKISYKLQVTSYKCSGGVYLRPFQIKNYECRINNYKLLIEKGGI